MDLSFLFEGSAPPSTTTSATSQTNLPDWYQEYLRGVAGRATQIAGQGYQAYENPAGRIAGFTEPTQRAFAQTAMNQGSWQPGVSQAMGAAGQIQGALAPYAQAGQQNANALVGHASASWPQNSAAYMNPYQSQVVDEIARLGNRNFQENLLPQIDSTFVGAGQFGSSRNAEILGRSMRDTQRDITGQQSAALQQGWNTSANIFNQDQSRQIGALNQAGQLNSNLGQMSAAAASDASKQFGALGQMTSQLGATDAAALDTIGQQQQNLNQRNLDLQYQNFVDQRDWDRNNIGFLNSAIRGMQMPSGQTSTTFGPANAYQPSPLSQIAGAYSAYRGLTGNNTART